MSSSARFIHVSGGGQPAGGRGFSAVQPIQFPTAGRKFGPVAINQVYLKTLRSEESEDAVITGLTRSLERRLLGLNLRSDPEDAGERTARIA